MSQIPFGERLRQIRESKKYTRLELAELAELALRSLENWEQGISEPKWSNVVKLANALGVGVEEFQQAGQGEGNNAV